MIYLEGKKFKALLVIHGIRQRKFAEMAGMAEEYLSRILKKIKPQPVGGEMVGKILRGIRRITKEEQDFDDWFRIDC